MRKQALAHENHSYIWRGEPTESELFPINLNAITEEKYFQIISDMIFVLGGRSRLYYRPPPYFENEICICTTEYD